MILQQIAEIGIILTPGTWLVLASRQKSATRAPGPEPTQLSTALLPMARTAIMLMVTGTMIVPVMDAIAKHLGGSMSPVQITWGRFLFQFLIMAILLLSTQGYRSLVPNRPMVQAIRGIQLALSTVCFFWSLVHLPLVNAISIFFVQPMVLTLISALFLGETVGWHRRIAVCAGFIGVMLIIQPGSDTFTWAAILPLGAAVFYASYMATTRAYAQDDHPVTMQFASGFGAAIFLSLLMCIGYFWQHEVVVPSMPNSVEWFWLFAIGAIAAVGHLLVVMAISRAPTSLLAPFGYTEIIAATILGWLIFKDWPDWLSWIGIAIIIASGIYVFERERRVTTTH